jgi:hypothetical protein
MRLLGKTLPAGGLFVLCLVAVAFPAAAGFDNFFQGVKNIFTGENALSESDIAAGLKEALQVGTANAVAKTGQTGGYLDNPEIRIPLPEPLAKTEKLLRFAGYGAQVDAFSQSINRAAEQAAPLAKDLFWQAIRDMTLDDARRIYRGGDTSATDYFRRKTDARLREVFTPIVHDSLAGVGATRNFQELDAILKSLPFGESLSFDLDRYVTDGALNGLFVVLGEEERKIRQNPAARTTELLQKVFGATD